MADMNWTKPPKAKRSARVTAISDLLRGKHLTKDVEALGTVYTLRTLEPQEADWAAGLVPSETAFQTGQALPKALIAVALVAIDGSPVESEFAIPDGVEADAKKALEDPAVLLDWRRREVYAWLAHDAQDVLIDLLWKGYVELTVARRKALEEIPGLSKRTPTGASSPSSSLEKGSSSATQASAA